MKGSFVSGAAIALVLAMTSGVAHARLDCKGPVIRANDAPYNSLYAVSGQHVGIADEEILRQNVMTAVVGAYRTLKGPTTLPPGVTFKMVYKDGTRECGHIVSRTGTVQVKPVEGSQREFAGPGEVEETSWYINLFNRNQPQPGFYTVCWDYYTNGALTDSECEFHRV